MKFLFIVNCSSFFKSHFLHLALSIKDKGHRVAIAAGNENEKTFFESLGLEFYHIPLSRSGKNLFRELGSLGSIRRVFLEFKPDYAHMFTIKPVLYAGIINRLYRNIRAKNVVFSVTGLGSTSVSRSISGVFFWAFLKALYRFSLGGNNSKVIFENKDDLDFFVKSMISKEEQSFIVNGAGVDIDEFCPSKEKTSTITVVFVARMLKDKGVREYIEAGRILQDRNIPVELLLIGTTDPGNPSSMTDEELKNASGKGYVKHLGFRNDIANCYQKSHIACLPSYREGLPKSLIEAAACGLPIITTDVPGCRQMVSASKNGIIVPPRDPISLANAIQELVSNEKIREDMGEKSREIAKSRYSKAEVTLSFYKIYGLLGV
ncbi:glycosyltransferase family 4 protein [Vibrio parahaemolyticus]